MSFCEVLKDLRMERDITQKEVALACGLTPTCICQLENGSRNPTGSTIRELAKFFGCSADYLLELDDQDDTIASTFPAAHLSDEDREIISLFHALTPEYQAAALSTLRAWAGVQKTEISKKEVKK